jgi:glycosyltransferase involved in cell wall biosynthesis
VGAFCQGILSGLARRRDVAAVAFAVSWRRRHGIVERIPDGVGVVGRAMPARPLHAAWRRSELPPIEWFVGTVDVVHGTNFVVPPTRRAARVVTVHDLTVVRYPELCDGPTLAFPRLVRRALDRGAWIHTPSAHVAAEVVDAFGADPERVRAVHSGVPSSTPADPGAPGRFLPRGTERYVLAIGTAEPRKDLPGLVAAFGEIAGDLPDLALILAGPDGWGRDDLVRAIERSPFSSRIVRTGWVDGATLAGLLEGASLLAYPSLYEGFGFPPLQAMAVGVPVVATRAGALPEVLGDAASLVPPGDREALASALSTALVTGAVRADLVRRGRARAGALTWDRCAAGLEALYRSATDATGAAGGGGGTSR